MPPDPSEGCDFWQQERLFAADQKFDGGEFSASQQVNHFKPCRNCACCLYSESEAASELIDEILSESASKG
jgi:hypothetical protein